MPVPSISSILNITTPTQKLAMTGTALASAAIAASQVLVVPTQNAHITLDETTPDASSFYIPANAMVVLSITPGSKVTALADSSSGSIYVTGIN